MVKSGLKDLPVVEYPVVAEPTEQLGRTFRQCFSNFRLADYIVTNHAVNTTSPSDAEIVYPISDFINCDRFSASYQAYLHAIIANVEPKTYSQDIKDEEWRFAVKNEVIALEDNDTWTIETLPKGKKPIGCQWVFRIKYNSDGSIRHYKEFLVVLGNKQVAGTDYDETFAPVT